MDPKLLSPDKNNNYPYGADLSCPLTPEQGIEVSRGIDQCYEDTIKARTQQIHTYRRDSQSEPNRYRVHWRKKRLIPEYPYNIAVFAEYDRETGKTTFFGWLWFHEFVRENFYGSGIPGVHWVKPSWMRPMDTFNPDAAHSRRTP